MPCPEFNRLLPQFVGRGLGGQLLSVGTEAAWTIAERWGLPPVGRVWLHTCTLDGPTAMANYVARAYRVVRTETAEQDVADAAPGPWPGAR